MYKIKIFCPFASSDKCKEIYERINYTNEIDFYGDNRQVVITDDDDYTHAIILNTIMPDLKIQKENVKINIAYHKEKIIYCKK